MSLDRLIKAIIEKNNPTVAGLDPKLDYVPEYIKNEFSQNTAIRLRERLTLYSSSIKVLLTHSMMSFRLLNHSALIMKCMVGRV